MTHVPLWDRRFVLTWKFVYLVSNDIYESIKKYEFIDSVSPDDLYTLEFSEGEAFVMETNFHFITIEDGHEFVDNIHFSIDLGERVGVVQYLWWWYAMEGETIDSFHLFPRYIYFDEKNDNPIISMLFSHYERGRFAPYIKDPLMLKEKFEINDTLLFDGSKTEIENKRYEITKTTLADELRRLNEIPLYHNLVLNIHK